MLTRRCYCWRQCRWWCAVIVLLAAHLTDFGAASHLRIWALEFSTRKTDGMCCNLCVRLSELYIKLVCSEVSQTLVCEDTSLFSSNTHEYERKITCFSLFKQCEIEEKTQGKELGGINGYLRGIVGDPSLANNFG